MRRPRFALGGRRQSSRPLRDLEGTFELRGLTHDTELAGRGGTSTVRSKLLLPPRRRRRLSRATAHRDHSSRIAAARRKPGKSLATNTPGAAWRKAATTPDPPHHGGVIAKLQSPIARPVPGGDISGGRGAEYPAPRRAAHSSHRPVGHAECSPRAAYTFKRRARAKDAQQYHAVNPASPIPGTPQCGGRLRLSIRRCPATFQRSAALLATWRLYMRAGTASLHGAPAR